MVNGCCLGFHLLNKLLVLLCLMTFGNCGLIYIQYTIKIYDKMCSTYSLPIQSWNEETKMEEERKRFGNCLDTVKENCNKSV